MNKETTNQERREFVHSVLSSFALSLLPYSSSAFASISTDSRSAVIEILHTFLKKHLVFPSIQCGTRWGDGVPEYSEVELFLKNIIKLSEKNMLSLEQYLHKTRNSDLVSDNFMVIDGWVLTRTEVMAAASYVILARIDCKKTG